VPETGNPSMHKRNSWPTVIKYSEQEDFFLISSKGEKPVAGRLQNLWN
jgi:hypothetical protein